MEYRVLGPAGESTPAYEPGSVHFGVALMWRPSMVTPIPGTLRLIAGAAFFHGIVALLARIGDPVDGSIIQLAASHLTPWRLPRAAEAEQIAATMTIPSIRWPAAYAQHAWPGIIGTDSNELTADLVDGPNGALRHHSPDIYEHADWFPSLQYQCEVRYDLASGRREYHADRNAGEQFCNLGLYEAAAVLGIDPLLTTGHWKDDSFAKQGMCRPIDHVRVTGGEGIDLRDALRAAYVVNERMASGVESVSDHLPAMVELEV
jgi:endonuclease/exonuclease/phosphatase family metal-dependent hydrolase